MAFFLCKIAYNKLAIVTTVASLLYVSSLYSQEIPKLNIFFELSSDLLSKDTVDVTLYFQNNLLISLKHSLASPYLEIEQKQKGNYFLVVESSCCKLSTTRWKSDTLKQQTITVKLLQNQIELNEVEITQKRQRLNYSGDTLVIDTRGVVTRPHADASELFDNIEGLTLDINGEVSILGRKVKQVTVDGKRIFGAVPTLTLSMIRSGMVDKMEFVYKRLPSGETINVLNLTLNVNKKKGFYGDLGAGAGVKSNYTADLKLNKLMKSTFLNFFGTANNINKYPINTSDINRLSSEGINSTLNSKGSVIGLYEQNINDNLGNSESDIDDTFNGLNEIKALGGSVSLTTKSAEFNSYFMSENRQTNVVEQTITELFLTDKVQRNIENNDEKKRSQKQVLFLDGMVNISPKQGLKFTNCLNFESLEETTFSNFVSIFSDSNDVINSAATKPAKDIISNTFQGLWFLKGKKTGQNTSIFINHYLKSMNDDINANITLNNETSSQVFDVKKDKGIQNITIQGVSSFPLTNHLLFEAKVKSTIQQFSLFQTGFRGVLKSSGISGNLNTTDYQHEVGSYLLYQDIKWSFIGGVSLWNWNSERNLNDVKQDLQNYTFRLHLARVQFQPASNVRFAISRISNPKTPSWEIYGLIPDSSNVQEITTSNINLTRFFEEKYELENIFTLNSSIQLSLSTGIKTMSNPIISKVNFNEFSGITTYSFINGSDDIRELYSEISVFPTLPSKKISWGFTGTYTLTNGYYVNNDVINYVKYSWMLVNPSLRIKFSKDLKIKTVFQTRIQSRGEQNLNLITLQPLINFIYAYKNKLFIDFSSQANLTISKSQKTVFQPIADFSLSTYFFKNSALKGEVILKNALDTRSLLSVSQSAERTVSSSINVLPRLLQLSLTLYPESWK